MAVSSDGYAAMQNSTHIFLDLFSSAAARLFVVATSSRANGRRAFNEYKR